ncbi:hypothetical protein NDU88_007693 [Pleurodeles waltl]|uniref:Uncharacterized protein n=1 Tax=Pleurodeles waltl TaxID=8319 RepID=A0AAV7STG8_PLEWA|nr:hypothetical protein NDU88_007693 [Pleurodeles waltl]
MSSDREKAKQLISPAAKSTSSKTVRNLFDESEVGNLFDESEDRSLPQSQRTPSELAQRLTEPKSKLNLRFAKKLLLRSRWRSHILKSPSEHHTHLRMRPDQHSIPPLTFARTKALLHHGNQQH